MMARILNEKNGQIGTTITWVVAFIIILVLMVGFLVISMALSGKSETEISFEEGVENLENQRTLIAFLNSHVEVDGTKKTVYNLVKESEINADASEIFKKSANEFISTIFTEASWKGGVHPWWIRVQEKEDEIKKPISTSNFRAGAFNCRPEEDVISVINVGDKKIVLCVLKGYYSK